MKRRKILVLIPALGLLLTGCSFQEGFSTAKHWVGQHIYHPLKDWIDGLMGKKEEPTPEPTPEPGPGPVDPGLATPVEITEVRAPESIEQDKTLDPSSVPLSVKYSDGTTKTHAATDVKLDTSKVAQNVEGTAYYNDLSKTFKINVTEPSPVSDNNVKVAYDAALALANNTPSEQEYTFDGVVVGINGNSFYVQKDGYGMYVYNKATEGIALGKVVTVTGTVKQYNGLPETAVVSSSVVTGEGTLPTAAVVSNMETLAALKVNVLASVAEASFVSKNKEWNSSNTGVRFVFSIGGDDVTVNFDKFGYDEAKATLLNGAAVGQKFALGNVLTNVYVNNDTTTAQLSFAGSSSVEAIAIAPESVAITSATALNLGSDLTLTATVGPAGAPQDVTWEIVSGSEYATLNGNVLTGTAAGDVVVKATVVGTTISSTATISVSGVPATTETITLDFSSGDITEFPSESVNQKIKYTYVKDSGTSSPTYTQAKNEPQYSLKLYANNYLCIEIDTTGASDYSSFSSIQTTATSKNGTTAGSGEFYKDNMESTALYTHSLTTATFTESEVVSLDGATKIYIKCASGQYRIGKFVLVLNKA